MFYGLGNSEAAGFTLADIQNGGQDSLGARPSDPAARRHRRWFDQRVFDEGIKSWAKAR